MAKIRTGIEIPIIPEDFEDPGESLLPTIMESCLEGSDRDCQDDLYAVEWAIVESLFDQHSQG